MTQSPTHRLRTVEEVYGSPLDTHKAFEEALSESLQPRGYDLLFDVVAELDLPSGATALDVGCREAHHSFALARRFGLTVHGVDPLRSHLDGAARILEMLTEAEPETAARLRVSEGTAENLPERDGAVDLIWCRDVLEHVADLRAAFVEFRRVLKPGGRVVIFHMTSTEWLTPEEAARLWPPLGCHAASMDPQHLEASMSAAGLTIDRCIELHGEWREYAEENGLHRTSKQLLHASRLLRERATYEERFGTDAYEMMLSNSLWGIYQMIGKLSPRVYVLSAER